MKGSLHFVFHSHLPFIKHPEYEWFLEELWLFEAISESYLPFIRVLENLDLQDINITISLSPVLMSMLSDSFLINRYKKHIINLLELQEKELLRVKNKDPRLKKLLNFYNHITKENLTYIENNENILQAFQRLNDCKKINLITTSASYAYLPAYEPFPFMVNTQIKVGLQAFEHHMKKKTNVFFLPECGYYERLEKILEKNRVKYSYLAPNSVLFSSKPPSYGVFNPIITKNGTVFFVQDLKSNNLITDINGYPSDVNYRDFYRDIGYDLPLEYVKNYISPDGNRIFTGIKYHKISGSEDKDFYDLDEGIQKAKQHAKEYFEFQKNRSNLIIDKYKVKNPVFVNYFSTELFGHRWFEGFFFLEELIKLVNKSDCLEFSTAESYFKNHDNKKEDLITTKPLMSSWTGYSSLYINDRNANIYKDLHNSAIALEDMIHRNLDAEKLNSKLINQAVREILLSQSLDWLMIMKNGLSSDYAKSRIKNHLLSFFKIRDNIITGNAKLGWITELEQRDNIFPFLDFKTLE